MVRQAFLFAAVFLLLIPGGCNNSEEFEIKGFWKKFSKSLKARNYERFREMSLPKIDCRICVENSEKEDSTIMNFKAANPDSWNDKVYGELAFIPVNKFIENEFDILFDEALLSKMKNTSSVNFISREFTREEDQKYLDDFLDEGRKYILYEALITTQQPSTQFEGAQAVIQILETNKGLKFYGYSTIP